jgi:hypothetical protein
MSRGDLREVVKLCPVTSKFAYKVYPVGFARHYGGLWLRTCGFHVRLPRPQLHSRFSNSATAM